MSERHITFPADAEFKDGASNEILKVQNEDGSMSDHPNRSFIWFLHTYLLSHLQFSIEVGGHEAVRSAKQIARSADRSYDAGEPSFAVSANDHKRLMCCIARADDEDADELLKPRPNPRILAKSSHGMSYPMKNYETQAFIGHLDAVVDASVNKPEAAQ